jgi:hypothetical protein
MFVNVAYHVHASLQTPTHGDCDAVLAYHIKKGIYGQTQLDGLNVLALSYFRGNIWAGVTKAIISIFFDEKANQEQREALNMIFGGKAGGFMAEFTKIIGEVRESEYAQISLKSQMTFLTGVQRYLEKLLREPKP